MGGKTCKALVWCFQRTHITKSLKWKLGQVLAIVLEDFGCQWQPPNFNWLKPTLGIYCLTGLKKNTTADFSFRHSWIQAQTVHEDSAPLSQPCSPACQLHSEMPCGVPWELKAHNPLPAGHRRGRRAAPCRVPPCVTVAVRGEGPLMSQTTAMHRVPYEGLELYEKSLVWKFLKKDSLG